LDGEEDGKMKKMENRHCNFLKNSVYYNAMNIKKNSAHAEKIAKII
jgi:hypothetical protein